VDLHPHRWRRADQQPRRTRPPRRRHLPQALTRQPIRARRTHDRAAPLRLDHLPPPEALALRLPHRRPQRQHPRRPHPRARLIKRGAERLHCSGSASPGSSARTAGAATNSLEPSRRQLCWAHLLRDFTADSEGMGEQKRFGEDDQPLSFRRDPSRAAVTSAVEAELPFLQGRSSLCSPRDPRPNTCSRQTVWLARIRNASFS
jgi:hypothetical protein